MALDLTTSYMLIMMDYLVLVLTLATVAKLFMAITGIGGATGAGQAARNLMNRRRENANREGGGPRREREDGEEGPEERRPYDASDELNQIEQLLNQYEREYANEFVPACRDVLQTHHDYLRHLQGYGPPRNSVTPNQQNRITTSSTRLNTIALNIANLFHQISNHPDFGNILVDQRNRYNALSARLTIALNATETYRQDFFRRFSNGDPPA